MCKPEKVWAEKEPEFLLAFNVAAKNMCRDIYSLTLRKVWVKNGNRSPIEGLTFQQRFMRDSDGPKYRQRPNTDPKISENVVRILLIETISLECW